MSISNKIGISIFVALLLLVLPLLSACGGDNEKESPTTVPTAQTAKPPAGPEGTLTIAVPVIQAALEWSPFSRTAPNARLFYGAMADYLVYDSRDGSGFVPGLAERWEIAPDKTSITLYLRQGVQFHDGWGELTAEDVKFTIETAMDPDLSKHNPAITSLEPLVDHIEIIGPYELTIYLKMPFADEFLIYLSPSHNLGLAITSKAYYDEHGISPETNKKPVYSGPYRMVEHSPGERLILKALPDHWRVVPEFETLVVKEVPELATRVAMLETGEADIIDSNVDQALYLEEKGFKIVSIPRAAYLEMPLLGQWFPERETYDPNLPWLDKRVREAMNLAVNKQEIAQYLLGGYAAPIGCLLPTPLGNALEPYPYDPERAKQLLAEAGYEGGFKVDVWEVALGSQSPEMDSVTQAVVGYWKEIGLDPEINSYSIGAVIGNIFRRDTSGVTFVFTHLNRGKPFLDTYAAFLDSQDASFPLYESEETDRLLEAALAATATKDRDSYVDQITQYLHDEYAIVPLVAVDKLWVTGDKVGEWNPFNVATYYLEYITHKQPLGTFRLFEP